MVPPWSRHWPLLTQARLDYTTVEYTRAIISEPTSFPGGRKSRPSSVQPLGAITVRLTAAVSRQLDWAELLNIKQCSSFCVDLQQKQVLGNHRLTFSIYSIIISDETSIRERLAVTDKRTNHYRLRLQAIG